MRRSAALFLCLCLMAALLCGCGNGIGQYQGPEEQDAADTAQAEPTATPDPGLGFAAYAPDTVVATYNGSPVTWTEYYYWLNYNVGYVDYLAMMGLFTFSDSWDGRDINEEYTDGQLVQQTAWDTLAQYRAVETLAAEQELTVDEAEVQAYFEQSADANGDGDGVCTQEEADAFEQYLAETDTDRAFYDDMTRRGLLSDALFTALYGADASGCSDELAAAYAQDQGIMAAKHILLLTKDMATDQALDEDVIAEKKQTADELYAQLAQVEDDPEALEELFDQLMQEHSEDTGLASNPDGYVFGEGVMVTAFEDTVKGLPEYGLSQPVQSDYGYHIILRLPVDPDTVVLDSAGQGLTARQGAAQADFTDRVLASAEAAEVVWEDGFDALDMAAIFGQR